MAIDIPNQEAKVGIPSQWSDTINAPLGALFLSSHPSALTFNHRAAAATALSAGTVVGLNASGQVVAAEKGTPANGEDPAVDGVAAIGVLAIDVTATTSAKDVPVYRVGHFNIERLTFDDSFATEADKLAAFEGAPSPTQIRLGKPASYTP